MCSRLYSYSSNPLPALTSTPVPQQSNGFTHVGASSNTLFLPVLLYRPHPEHITVLYLLLHLRHEHSTLHATLLHKLLALSPVGPCLPHKDALCLCTKCSRKRAHSAKLQCIQGEMTNALFVAEVAPLSEIRRIISRLQQPSDTLLIQLQLANKDAESDILAILFH